MEPVLILDPSKSKERKEFEILKKLARVVDDYKNQAEEYKAVTGKKVSKFLWVFYPWHNALVKILPEKEFRIVRNSRNQNLITKEEQKKFAGVKVAFAGLNVGNPGALCTALEGGSVTMRLADFDPLSLSNLNRFRAGLHELGVNKAVLSARQIWETDPFYKLEVWGEGIMPGEEERFLDGADILVEEIDYLPMKVTLREIARAKRIPVVMVTGNGAGLILDVERYDQNPKLPILNGYLKKEVIEKIKKITTKTPVKEKINLMRDFIGKKYLDPRLNKSFNEVGKKLAGIPQLAEASYLRGAVLANAIRKIATGNLKSGRFFINFEKHV